MRSRVIVLLTVVALIVGACAADSVIETPDSTGSPDPSLSPAMEPVGPAEPAESVERTESVGQAASFEIRSEMVALEAGVTYVTSSTRIPQLSFTAPSSGWSGSDSMACAYELGTLILVGEKGRMFVVPTAAMEVDDAVAVLADSSFISTSVADVQIGDRCGRRFSGVLDLGSPTHNIGGSRRGGSLMPYHRVTEDVLGDVDGGPLVPGSEVEIYVLETEDGILSVALVTEQGGMSAFRSEALALAETIEFTSYQAEDTPSC